MRDVDVTDIGALRVAFEPVDLALLDRWLREQGRPGTPELFGDGGRTRDVETALVRTWSSTALNGLGELAARADVLEVVLLLGVARWAPVDLALDVLAQGGLTLEGCGPVSTQGHIGVAIQLVRGDAAPGATSRAAIELGSWTTAFERGRAQPVRVAAERLAGLPIADLPMLTDVRERWVTSQPALRMASPEILLLDPKMSTDPGAVARREVVNTWGAREHAIVDGSSLDRVVLDATELLGREARRASVRPEHRETSDLPHGDDEVARDSLRSWYCGDLSPTDGISRIVPDVKAAHSVASASLAGSLERERALTALRGAILRMHSSVGWLRALARYHHTDLLLRPLVSVLVDHRDHPRDRSDTTRSSLFAQSRPADRVVDVSGAEILREELADLFVLVPNGTRLDASVLDRLELGWLVWRSTVQIIPRGFEEGTDGGLTHREVGSHGLGPSDNPGAAAVEGRLLRAVAVMLGRTPTLAELISVAVERGGLCQRLSAHHAIFPASEPEGEALPGLVIDDILPSRPGGPADTR